MNSLLYQSESMLHMSVGKVVTAGKVSVSKYPNFRLSGLGWSHLVMP